MSTPVPPRTEPFDGLPPVALEFGAWLKFNSELNVQLREFEARYVRPRRHAVTRNPQPGRMTPRKPR
ncbi:MAG: hypothetical protein KF847_13520 [Pirellulales bacterium]|nr:hypothetical protein [Pirellulales bacterium]